VWCVHIIHGKPRYCLTQGFIEISNQGFQNIILIAIMMKENDIAVYDITKLLEIL